MMEHLHVDDCDSTQDLLKEQLDRTPAADWVVSCENQSRGYGRGSNMWTAMPGTLCFSMTISPHPIPTLTSLEMGLLIRDFFDTRKLKLRLKWPNDLFVEQKKCGGLIIQSYKSTYVLGLGINLYTSNSEFGGLFKSEIIFSKQDLSWRIADYIREHRIKDSHLIRERWLANCDHLHKRVQIIEHQIISEGIFIGIGEVGEAILKNDEGETKSYFNGSLRVKLT